MVALAVCEKPRDEVSEMHENADDPWLEAARAGDAQALERLLERHQDQIYRFSMKMCRDPQDASDVLQDTLLAMARGIGDFRGASSISTWLYTIARSHCIKKRRKRKLAPEQTTSLDEDPSGSAAQLADPAQLPDEVVANQQASRALEDAIAGLSPMYREVLVLRDVEGLAAAEVAEVLGTSVQAVKSRLHRARLAVRAQIAPALGLAPEEPEPKHERAPTEGCPEILLSFSRHLEDEISAEVCAEMERHLKGCPRCQSACDSLRRTLALCHVSAGSSTQVPASVQASVKVAVRNFLAHRP